MVQVENNLIELITKKQIKSKIIELGNQITKDFKKKDLVVVCVLKGSFIFCADLIREIKLPLSIDFVGMSSYNNTSSTEKIEVTKTLQIDIKDKDVLLVEDIIDTGLSINFMIDNLKYFNPNSISTCTLINAPNRRKIPHNPNYCCFGIDDEFIIGYGLDLNQKYRNLKSIYKLKEF